MVKLCLALRQAVSFLTVLYRGSDFNKYRKLDCHTRAESVWIADQSGRSRLRRKELLEKPLAAPRVEADQASNQHRQEKLPANTLNNG